MSGFNLDRFKYQWKGDWQPGYDYIRDDVVLVGGSSYVCIVTHTSSSDFRTDQEQIVPDTTPPIPAPRWAVMTSMKHFTGNWNTGNAYNLNDIVLYQGSLYICKVPHTSGSFASDSLDLTLNDSTDIGDSKWQLYALGQKYTNNWITGTVYGLNSLVKYGGIVYKCTSTHVSTVFESETDKWEVFYLGVEWKDNWSPSVIYKLNDLVSYGGSIFRCKETHTAIGNFIDPFRFELEIPGQQYDKEWSNVVYYNQGDVVRYGGDIYQATQNNYDQQPSAQYEPLEFLQTGTITLTVRTTPSLDGQGNKYTINGDYQPSLVLVTGFTYIFDQTDITNFGHPLNFSADSLNGERDGGTTFLENVTYYINGSQIDKAGYDLNFNSATSRYVEITITSLTPNLLYYWCTNHNNMGNSITMSDVNTEFVDDSTFFWKLLSPAYNFKGLFDKSYTESYKTGDVVQRGGYLYRIEKDINLVGAKDSTLDYLDNDYWNLLVPGKIFLSEWRQNSIYALGDVIIYKGSTYVCNTEHEASDQNFPGDNGSGYVYWDLLIQAGQEAGMQYKGDLLTFGLSRTEAGDGSTLGLTRVPIGNQLQTLSVDEEGLLHYRNLGYPEKVIYVGTNGKDLVSYGTSADRPFRTIRHACEYIEENFAPGTLCKVSVTGGRFEEIGPISIPAGTVVMGDELRSTTIVASGPKDSYLGNYRNNFFATLDRIRVILPLVLSNSRITVFPGNTILQPNNVPIADAATITFVQNLLDSYKSKVNFYVGVAGGVDVTVTGSNIENTNVFRANAAIGLRLLKDFLVKEASLYIQSITNNLNEEQIESDLHQIILALIRDTKYDGNYATLNQARYFANSITGSKRDDLFWARDTTGIRNCTLDGLSGTLNPPNIYIQYQRPTGGSYVSLDPGWGPDDNRVWITNRSPYLQGVTNIGYACFGNKIDGSLHNGGNKSMVSNDFTQVLSDGIGINVLNGGRTELVSVFTYYCQIGYYAETGGIIRATNGNNSYGNFGAIAEGIDPNEIPIQGTINNRTNNAIVESAIAGGSTDQMLLFEYTHAGEEYSDAKADIEGAGFDAEVYFDDFRDGAIHDIRLLTTDSSAAGGDGYLVKQNSAQATNPASQSIVINQNDTALSAGEYLGMRILIVRGTGIGQYGYISGFDVLTKEVTVKKESNDELGWDHVIPGYPIEATLDSTTLYRIEPRLTVSHPGFSSVPQNLPQARDFISAATGGTTATYLNVVADSEGTGQVDEELTPFAAYFNVTRKGNLYETVELSFGGAGYAVGDKFKLLGTALGGTSPDNDIQITVTEVTNDSTNAIVSYTFSGIGRKERTVALVSARTVLYSDNLVNWTYLNLPASGEAFTCKKIVAGNNVFVVLNSDTNLFYYSKDGASWSIKTLPSTANWSDITYGEYNGFQMFIAISENSTDSAYSFDGENWTASVLPAGDDSTGDQWQKVVFGQGLFIAITGSQTRDIAVSYNGSWTKVANVLPVGDFNWVGLEYGNGRFLALDQLGQVVYSVDKGQTWYAGTTAPGNKTWTDIKYAQGVFVAVCGEEVVATTEDGLNWISRTIEQSNQYTKLAFTNINDYPEWVAFANTATINAIARITTGARAILRANIDGEKFTNIKIWNPGSGYQTTPTLTITDPNVISPIDTDNRLGNGVLSQPVFINRGTGYKTTTSSILITGNGYADIIPSESNTIAISGIPFPVPGPGIQIKISTIDDDTTDDPDDLKRFTGIFATDLGDDGSGNNTRTIRFTISPKIKNENNLEHGTPVTLNENYSQCRISGHDFLDIGTGNFIDTNYPDLYASGNYFVYAPENEVVEIDGGRVFYTSTDQDGNFRTGELFGVNQATGVVTISAEFFDLDGLTELSLGGVRLGGSGTVVNEFSTDITFSADSNNVIPTQRAIAAFLADRLSVGGSDLELNSLIVGTIKIGGIEDSITSGTMITVNRPTVIEGRDSFNKLCAIQGTFISQMLFFRQNENND